MKSLNMREKRENLTLYTTVYIDKSLYIVSCGQINI
jgi:hypothetical protein